MTRHEGKTEKSDAPRPNQPQEPALKGDSSMHDGSDFVTTSSGATGGTVALKFDAALGELDAEAMRGLFDVEVYGINEFALVPRNDLARSLAGTWLHGEVKRSLHMLGVRKPTPGATSAWERRDNVTRLTFRMDLAPVLSSGGDPFCNGLELTPEEHAGMRAAVDAHREAKRAEAAPAVAKPGRAKRKRAR